MVSQSEKDSLWEKHKPYIEVLAQVNNSYVFVAALREKYLFVSSNFSDFFDYIADYASKTIEERGDIIDSSG